MIAILWPLTEIENIRANSGQASKIFSFRLLHYRGFAIKFIAFSGTVHR